MTGSPILMAIQERLRGVGYGDLPTPIKVAGVEFAFTGVMRGQDGRALDLVVLVDTTTGDFGDSQGDRVRQRIEGLSRALDVSGSRFVVTAILAGAVLTEGIEALSETCRVLLVEGVALDDEGKPSDVKAERELDDSIRVLLPLTLPEPIAESTNGSGPAMQQLVQALPTDINIDLVNALISASSTGEQAVSKAIAQVMERAFHPEAEEKQL